MTDERFKAYLHSYLESPVAPINQDSDGKIDRETTLQNTCYSEIKADLRQALLYEGPETLPPLSNGIEF